jgi:hypothetical protein
MKTFTALPGLITLLVGIGVLFLTSCQKYDFPDTGLLPKGLIGSWVEVNTKTDTLIFNSNSDTGMVILQRGYEIRNGYRLPVIGSTVYKYMIFSDSIKLIDGLSSTWNETTHYFNFDEPNLIIRIGKFSKYINSKRSNLTFRKIKR